MEGRGDRKQDKQHEIPQQRYTQICQWSQKVINRGLGETLDKLVKEDLTATIYSNSRHSYRALFLHTTHFPACYTTVIHLILTITNEIDIITTF